MAKNDNDLFDRLRQVGLRKQVAKTLSGIGENAGKKARTAAESAVSELRAVADELERRMPGGKRAAGAGRASARTTKRSAPSRSSRASARSAAAKPRAARSRSSAASSATRTRRTTAARTPARSPAARTAAASRARTAAPAKSAAPAKAAAPARASATAAQTTPARAPRGQNKAKILASLKSGPKTASVIAKETGIGTGTVGSTLSKLATSGEVVKAARGYGLPS